jgi:aryl-alcohol dehydrogenase-like predicted oxidoreductase
LDQGINIFDTADIYGQGESERIIGDVLASRKQQVTVVTKSGYRFGTAGSLGTKVKPLLRSVVRMFPGSKKILSKARASQMSQDFSEPYLSKAIEASLRRLRRDALDVFLLHSPPRPVIESDEAFELLERFKASGKIRYYGVSCLTVEDALACLKRPGISVLQLRMNLAERQPINLVLPRAQEADVAVIAREVLSSGNLLRGKGVDAEVAGILQTHSGGSIAQAALEFILAQEGVSVALVGTTNLLHLRESIGAVELLRPTPSRAS